MGGEKNEIEDSKERDVDRFSIWEKLKKIRASLFPLTLCAFTLIGIPITINIFIDSDDDSRDGVLSSQTMDTSSVANVPQIEGSQKTSDGSGQKCLSSSETAVPCDTQHDGEVISSVSSCGSDVLVNYMGGNVAVDTLSPGISYEPISSGCKVSFPYSLEESVEGKWVADLRHLPGLRSCFNPDRADQVVGCNEPHTGEVVYSQSGGDGANLSCDAKAADYMDANKDKWQDMLKTEGIEHNGSWLCVAKTRNNNFLDGTLRSLGSQKIKTKPR